MSFKNAVSMVVGLEARLQEFIDVTHSFAKLDGGRRKKDCTIARRAVRIKHLFFFFLQTKGDLYMFTSREGKIL